MSSERQVWLQSQATAFFKERTNNVTKNSRTLNNSRDASISMIKRCYMIIPGTDVQIIGENKKL